MLEDGRCVEHRRGVGVAAVPRAVVIVAVGALVGRRLSAVGACLRGSGRNGCVGRGRVLRIPAGGVVDGADDCGIGRRGRFRGWDAALPFAPDVVVDVLHAGCGGLAGEQGLGVHVLAEVVAEVLQQ